MKPPTFPGIDYGFRPASYWEAPSPLATILLNVKGTNRRRMIVDFWNAGKFEELEEDLKLATLPGELIHRLGRIHPTFMGGEYLPNYRSDEIEIARIELDSTLADVISIRARLVGTRLRYSIVDEYETEFVLARSSSQKPFSLGELVRFIDESSYPDGDPGLALINNEANAVHLSREDLRHFTTIHSDLYPQLQEHFEHVFEAWVQVAEPKTL